MKRLKALVLGFFLFAFVGCATTASQSTVTANSVASSMITLTTLDHAVMFDVFKCMEICIVDSGVLVANPGIAHDLLEAIERRFHSSRKQENVTMESLMLSTLLMNVMPQVPSPRVSKQAHVDQFFLKP